MSSCLTRFQSFFLIIGIHCDLGHNTSGIMYQIDSKLVTERINGTMEAESWRHFQRSLEGKIDSYPPSPRFREQQCKSKKDLVRVSILDNDFEQVLISDMKRTDTEDFEEIPMDNSNIQFVQTALQECRRQLEREQALCAIQRERKRLDQKKIAMFGRTDLVRLRVEPQRIRDRMEMRTELNSGRLQVDNMLQEKFWRQLQRDLCHKIKEADFAQKWPVTRAAMFNLLNRESVEEIQDKLSDNSDPHPMESEVQQQSFLQNDQINPNHQMEDNHKRNKNSKTKLRLTTGSITKKRFEELTET